MFGDDRLRFVLSVLGGPAKNTSMVNVELSFGQVI